jgi:hypothetical protein
MDDFNGNSVSYNDIPTSRDYTNGVFIALRFSSENPKSEP